MPYINGFEIKNHHNLPDFQVELPHINGRCPHVILTGPNGAGKTTVLEAMANWFAAVERSGLVVATTHQPYMHMGNGRPSAGFRFDLHGERVSFNQERQEGRFIAAYLPAQRTTKVSAVNGPNNKKFGLGQSRVRIASSFLQYLVNIQVQARLADDSIPEEAAERQAIFDWWTRFEEQLANLFDKPGLKLDFVRKAYDVRFREPSGVTYGFNQLAAGHASIISILAELILRIDATHFPWQRDSEELSGVVLIDEISLHLHPALQEKVLPFLTGLFPRLQFIVTTHSPLVLASVDDAIIVDLSTQQTIQSAHYQGTPYGQLYQAHFHVTDVDLATTKALQRLETLHRSQSRSASEDNEYRRLVHTLLKTDHSIVREAQLAIWNEDHKAS